MKRLTQLICRCKTSLQGDVVRFQDDDRDRHYVINYCFVHFNQYVHRVSKKTSTHIIGYKLRNSCPILIIVDIKIPHII